MGRVIAIFMVAFGMNAADVLVRQEWTTRELAPGGTDEVSLGTREAGYFQIEVQPQGSRLTVSGTTGQEVSLSDAPMRPVRLCWLQDTPRESLVRLRSLETTSRRKYSIRWVSRPAQPQDEDRVQGCALEARSTGLSDPVQRAEALEGARKAFQRAEDWQGLAEVLTPLGNVLWDLGRNLEAI